MARKRPQQVTAPTSFGTSLTPLAVTQGRAEYLDPTVAAEQIPHPSARWAGIELQPVKPR